MRETEEEMIKRRSENADAAMWFLFSSGEWLWTIGMLIGFGLLGFWVVG